MGCFPSVPAFGAVPQSAARRVGSVSVAGRYHRLPERFEFDYKLDGAVLGDGANGAVVAARGIANGVRYAVKRLSWPRDSVEARRTLECEAAIFLALDHPHVARLVDVYESKSALTLVMECMAGGQLFDRLVERKRFSEADAQRAVWQMLLAINYLHSHDIVHRDIKLENFLFAEPGSDVLKLIDFGFSSVCAAGQQMTADCGTLGYVAPEVLSQAYTSQCDMWSLGVVVYILLFGCLPFYGPNQLQCIKIGRYVIKEELAKDLSQAAVDFVRRLLVVDPGLRLAASEAMQHEWLNQHSARSAGVDHDTVEALCSFRQAPAFRRACMLMMAWSLPSAECSRMQDAFLRWDRNRNGTITLAEFKEMLTEAGMPEDSAEEAFKALDMSCTREILYSEFLAAMMCKRIPMCEEVMQRTFRRFDKDRSGTITAVGVHRMLGAPAGRWDLRGATGGEGPAGRGGISYGGFVEYLQAGEGAGNEQGKPGGGLAAACRAWAPERPEQLLRRSRSLWPHRAARGGASKARVALVPAAPSALSAA